MKIVMKVFVRRFGSGFQRPRADLRCETVSTLYCKDLHFVTCDARLSGYCMNAGMRIARHIESTADLTSLFVLL